MAFIFWSLPSEKKSKRWIKKIRLNLFPEVKYRWSTTSDQHGDVKYDIIFKKI